MNAAVIEFLRCPDCGSVPRLIAVPEPDGGIREGAFECACGRKYPIRDGVGHFSGERYTSSFSFQWHAQADSAHSVAEALRVKLGFLTTMGVDPASLRGRRVLDAGCGRGILSRLLAEHGAEVVGIDLSDGVTVAARRVREFPSAAILRADILDPPLADASFDAVFSFGVLHHTADCRAAFLRLVRLLRPGGRIGIWVYSDYSRFRNRVSDLLRRVTTRLPPHLLYGLCHLAVPLNWLQQVPVLGLPFRIIPVAGEGGWRWVVLGTYDWYSPVYQSRHTFPEVFGWFEEAGLEGIRVHEWGICVSGRRPASP